MVACMVILAIANLTLDQDTLDTWQITYWMEALALGSFGIAWIVAGKLALFVDQSEDKLQLFG